MNVLNIPVVKYSDSEFSSSTKKVAMEEPLEIYVDDEPFYMTMRLPGEEIPLAVGLCFTDGIIRSMDDLAGANYCSDLSANKINIYLSDKRKKEGPIARKQKKSPTYSSCGICGSDMIQDISTLTKKIEIKTVVEFKMLERMQQALVEKQSVYHETGGTHAAGLFDAKGSLLAFAEDVGRHNALDKAIGKALFDRKIQDVVIIQLSSRLSYEMVMKATRCGTEILAGVSAATTLAIELARTMGLTLIGSFRGNKGDVYTYPERLGKRTH